MDYSALSDQINSLITSESEKVWVSIPGGLDKVSESSMGAVWGIKGGELYACLTPCNGQWTLQEFPEASPNLKILDFTTDDSLVYVLWNNPDTQMIGLMTKNGNNSGEWSRASLSPKLTNLFNTSSYIWGQLGKQKYKLAKPGTTSNWILATDTSDVTITSASSTSLYGVDSKGVAYKTDEALQSAWTPIPQFKGVFTGILGDADQTGIYGVDTENQVQKCVGDVCEQVPINSPVQTLSPNPRNLWMTSTIQGKLGNIYYRDDLPSNLIKDTAPLDAQRDSIVEESEKNYDVSTYATVMSKQLTEIQLMLSGLLTQDKIDSVPIEKNLSVTTQQSYVLDKAIRFILRAILILIPVLIIYLFSGFLGSTTHYIAFAIFVGGIYFVLSNGV
jgi:hypothetical protein